MKKNFGLVMALLSIVLSSCTKQNEEFYKNKTVDNCDTTNTSFSATVLPIFQANCYVCHGTGSPIFGGVDLAGYDKIKSEILHHDVLQVINHQAGYVQMPQGAPKLADCDLAKIAAWVKAGLPNN